MNGGRLKATGKSEKSPLMRRAFSLKWYGVRGTRSGEGRIRDQY